MSDNAMRETTDVPFSSSMALLPKGGSIITRACGSTTWRMRCQAVKFSAVHASICSRGTACIAPRTISAA
jgi:hypothetical protein